jgi:hypothetical protein
MFLQFLSVFRFDESGTRRLADTRPSEIDKGRTPAKILAIRKLLPMGFSPSIRFAASF